MLLAGRLREAPRHQVGLHVCLRQGLGLLLATAAGRQRRHRRSGHRLQGLRRHLRCCGYA